MKKTCLNMLTRNLMILFQPKVIISAQKDKDLDLLLYTDLFLFVQLILQFHDFSLGNAFCVTLFVNRLFSLSPKLSLLRRIYGRFSSFFCYNNYSHSMQILHKKQGRKRPLDTPKRMIEGERKKERQKERYREGGRDKRER